jgi:hypothetical protein
MQTLLATLNARAVRSTDVIHIEESSDNLAQNERSQRTSTIRFEGHPGVTSNQASYTYRFLKSPLLTSTRLTQVQSDPVVGINTSVAVELSEIDLSPRSQGPVVRFKLLESTGS